MMMLVGSVRFVANVMAQQSHSILHDMQAIYIRYYNYMACISCKIEYS
jgi:hypothetical protein